MKPLKLFISQPMSEVSINEFMSTRSSIESKFKNKFPGVEYEIINPYVRDDAFPGAGRLWFLGKAIQDMDKADVIIFSGDAQFAKGCKIEMTIANEYSIPYIMEWDLGLRFCEFEDKCKDIIKLINDKEEE